MLFFFCLMFKCQLVSGSSFVVKDVKCFFSFWCLVGDGIIALYAIQQRYIVFKSKQDIGFLSLHSFFF